MEILSDLAVEQRVEPHAPVRISRAPIAGIEDYLQTWISEGDHHFAYRGIDEAHLRSLGNQLNDDLPQAKPQLELGRKALINDVVALSQVFLNQSQARSIDIQLQAIRKDMCRLFHADRVRTRLLCTYFGLGTEWLSENNLIRAGLGHGDNCGIVRDPSQINRAAPFEVLLLEGSLGQSGFGGIVHRSPPVEASDSVRFLLRIDESGESR